LLDRGVELPEPSAAERIDLCREHLKRAVERRGEPRGVFCTRRHISGYLKGLPGAGALRRELFQHDTLDRCLEVLDRFRQQRAA
jgi:tRNA-dihydrouridine synthase